MLRRLAITLAATSAIVLTATAPALATHNEPDYVIDDKGGGPNGPPTIAIDGQQVTFEYKREELCQALAELFSDQDGIFELVIPQTFKYDVPDEPPHDWIDAELTKDGDEWASLDIVVDEDKVPHENEGLHVIVKGGTKSNVYLGPDLTHLTAPDGKGISHYTICKVWVPEEEDNGDTPPPDDGDEPKEEDSPEPKAPESPEPKTTETPAAVPTAVPAGLSGSDGGSMAPIGLAAAVLMMVAGGAALLRRRFAHQN